MMVNKAEKIKDYHNFSNINRALRSKILQEVIEKYKVSKVYGILGECCPEEQAEKKQVWHFFHIII